MFVSGGLGSDRITPDFCAIGPACSGKCIMNSPPSFPSGSGTPARVCSGGYCFGQSGAAGMVKVSYS